ncbi:MAG TPA: HaeIII family restriction endonuclease [Candidatus Cloacimonetes bacterium]|nr:HaeIII family restriction endonuclease [Candidatus Cloacimonadota bacterium]
MNRRSNDNGRAFEYEVIKAFEREISKHRSVKLNTDAGYDAAKQAHASMSNEMLQNFRSAAIAAVKVVIDYEPLIIEKCSDCIDLSIQTDSAGKSGDVRDIIIARPNIKWEIGLSVKHNHDAVKHSRLSKNIDFGERWFNQPCSKEYWQDINPIFDYLEREKAKKTLWRDIPNKQQAIYLPLLNAFIEEIKRSEKTNKNIARNMVEYLVGMHDFYKIIGKKQKRVTEISTFNLRGELNQAVKGEKLLKVINISKLPTRILYIGMKQKSFTTVEMCLDNGWAFTFRIHNASSKVEPSLKFDIRLVGLPATILNIMVKWND